MSSFTKVVIIAGLLAVASGATYFIHRAVSSQRPPTFRFATVERGDIQASVSATGTLQAVTTVKVGTQVSGQISALLVDFNDQVRKGQLLARIDPTIAQQGVADARANLEKAEAQASQARSDQGRNRQLSSEGLIAATVLEQGASAQKVTEATVKSARVALERAKQNLSFTSIHAPIDGVVVERNVDNGQTVAASLSAPQLFLIANDLSRMQILAPVGESDIVRIQRGQTVSFTVQASPGETFTGTVEQVRLQSTTTDNVVNYSVVVTLENPEGKLLPGMTARVDFLVKSATDVLKAPNAALRFRPSDDLLARLGTTPAARSERPTTSSASSARSRGGDAPTRARRGERGTPENGVGTLYVVDAKGNLEVVPVRTGITDGLFTEVRGEKITAGMKVVDGVVSTSSKPLADAKNPMSGGQPTGRGRPGGGF